MTITDYYVTTDAMGSVTAILDEDGNVLERRNYDAFGGMTCMAPDGTPVAESPTGLDVGFQGQVRDEVTGLYQMGYRWYSPALGRWLSRDPIGLAGGVSLVCFVANKPLDNEDVTGLLFNNHYEQKNPVGSGVTMPSTRESREKNQGIRTTQGVMSGAMGLLDNYRDFLYSMEETQVMMTIIRLEKGESPLACIEARQNSKVKSAPGCGCCVVTLDLLMSLPVQEYTVVEAGVGGPRNVTVLMFPRESKPFRILSADVTYWDKPCGKLKKYRDYERGIKPNDPQMKVQSFLWSV